MTGVFYPDGISIIKCMSNIYGLFLWNEAIFGSGDKNRSLVKSKIGDSVFAGELGGFISIAFIFLVCATMVGSEKRTAE